MQDEQDEQGEQEEVEEVAKVAEVGCAGRKRTTSSSSSSTIVSRRQCGIEEMINPVRSAAASSLFGCGRESFAGRSMLRGIITTRMPQTIAFGALCPCIQSLWVRQGVSPCS